MNEHSERLEEEKEKKKKQKKGGRLEIFFHNYNCHPIRIVNKIRLGQMYSLRCCVLRTRAILKLINCLFLLEMNSKDMRNA